MLTRLWPYFREYWNTKTAGTYMCVCCSTPLFRSKSSLPELILVSIFILLCFRCLFFLHVIDLCPYHLAATPYWSPLHYCLIYCALICHHLHLLSLFFIFPFLFLLVTFLPFLCLLILLSFFIFCQCSVLLMLWHVVNIPNVQKQLQNASL